MTNRKTLQSQLETLKKTRPDLVAAAEEAISDPNKELILTYGGKSEDTVVMQTAKIQPTELKHFEALFKAATRDLATEIARFFEPDNADKRAEKTTKFKNALDSAGLAKCKSSYETFYQKALKNLYRYAENRNAALQYLMQFQAELTYVCAFTKAADASGTANLYANSLLRKVDACMEDVPPIMKKGYTPSAAVMPTLLPMDLATKIAAEKAAASKTAAASTSADLPATRAEATVSPPLFDLSTIKAARAEFTSKLISDAWDTCFNQSMSKSKLASIVTGLAALDANIAKLEKSEKLAAKDTKAIAEITTSLGKIVNDMRTKFEADMGKSDAAAAIAGDSDFSKILAFQTALKELNNAIRGSKNR